MFKPKKINKEQIDMLIEQSNMLKEYFSALEPCIEMSKNAIGMFPFTEQAVEHLESAQEQCNIYKNYHSMTGTYLKMVSANLDLWNLLYLNPKKSK